jgi:hypothetical protein
VPDQQCSGTNLAQILQRWIFTERRKMNCARSACQTGRALDLRCRDLDSLHPAYMLFAFHLRANYRSKGGTMKRTEREDLLQVCRMRERVAKAEATMVAAKRKGEFEAQLASIYSYDKDEVWKQWHEYAQAATQKAQEQIAKRAKELGVPPSFAPSIQTCWYGRGENAVRNRRAELTRVAYRKIEQLEKEAKLQIERASVDIQTRLVAGGLESAEARAFLEEMPSATQLMPVVSVEDVQKQLPGISDSEDAG